jgi:hypothetical protein
MTTVEWSKGAWIRFVYRAKTGPRYTRLRISVRGSRSYHVGQSVQRGFIHEIACDGEGKANVIFMTELGLKYTYTGIPLRDSYRKASK